MRKKKCAGKWTVMRDQELNKKVQETKKQINAFLWEGTSEAYEKVYEICDAEAYRVLRVADNTLLIMHVISNAWKMESSYLDRTLYQNIDRSIQEEPVAQLIKMYNQIKFYLFRMENDLSEESIEEGIIYILQQDYSGDLLYAIAIENIEEPVDTLLRLGKIMVMQKQYARAARIYALLRQYENNANPAVIIAHAQVYMEIGNYKAAYESLLQINEPDKSVVELLEKLKTYLKQ